MSVDIVYFKDYSRPAIAFQWLNILYIFPDEWYTTITWGLGHGDANMHLQLFHIGQNSDEVEWLVSMGIVVVEGYERPAIAFQWLNILYIGPRWMIQNNNLGLGSWWCQHAPAVIPYWWEFRWRRMASEHEYSGCWGICEAGQQLHRSQMDDKTPLPGAWVMVMPPHTCNHPK